MLPTRFRRFLLTVGVFGIGNFAATFLVLRATTLLVPQYGAVAGSALAIGLYTVYNAAYAASAYLAGEVADRVSKLFVLGLGYGLFGLTCLGFAVVGPSLPWLALLFVLAGAHIGMVDTSQGAYAAELLPAAVRGTGFGTLAAVNGLGDNAPLEDLVAGFMDPDPEHRYCVAGDLAGLGARAPIELLVGAMNDPENDYWARVAAASALWRLAEQDEVRNRVPVEPLLAALESDHIELQQAALAALAALDSRAPVEAIALALNDEYVCEDAAAALRRLQPAILTAIAAEATAIVLGQESGIESRWLVNDTVIDVVEDSGYATPAMLDQIMQLCEWPYSGTRVRAARALGRVRRNIPDAAIRRLLELRQRDPSRAVREASDDALTAILSLETGIEDD